MGFGPVQNNLRGIDRPGDEKAFGHGERMKWSEIRVQEDEVPVVLAIADLNR
jgi:hypothetical protein